MGRRRSGRARARHRSGRADLILLCGDDPFDPTLETIAAFFGVSLLPIGRSAPAGLVAATPEAFVRGDSPTGWLYTTTAEIDPAADPANVRATIERMRSQR